MDELDELDAGCSLAKISMVAERSISSMLVRVSCSLAKISMVAELLVLIFRTTGCCSLAKISMVAEQDWPSSQS